MTYRDQRLQPQWIALRERLFRERNYTCADCGLQYSSNGLDPHHKYYERGRMAWDYPDDCFKVLCNECHKHTTEALKNLLYTVGFLTGDQIVAFSDALQEALLKHKDNTSYVTNWLALHLELMAKGES